MGAETVGGGGGSESHDGHLLRCGGKRDGLCAQWEESLLSLSKSSIKSVIMIVLIMSASNALCF